MQQCCALRLELEALRATTNPEPLASERAKNAVLTGEIDRLREALESLIEKANEADDHQYGTLSTTFVRDVARAALS